MRLIDADALLHELIEMVRYSAGEYKYGIEAAKLVVIDAPTVAKDINAPNNGGWISVKDRLPEDETIVIAYVQHKIGWKRMFAWHGVYGWHSSDPDFDDKDSDYVTHWMPLPENPEVEG